jgi:mycothiol synthase
VRYSYDRVNPLSNFIRHRNDPATQTAGPVIVRPAVAAEVTPAFRMILGNGGYLADESQVAEFLRFSVDRSIQLSDLRLAESNGKMIWAVMAIVSPGRSMLLFGAGAKFAGGRNDAVSLTIDAVCGEFARRGYQLAQALIDPVDELSIGLYESAGFKRMAELAYLHREKRWNTPVPAVPLDCTLQIYSPQTHNDFAAAILASYEKSLDCPALNGVRQIEDIIAGHKAAGDFDPSDWFLLKFQGKPVAVLLLCQTIQPGGMELVYLGVAAWARGKRLGEWLMRLAEARMTERKLTRLTLAVDSSNAPALRLYHQHGMQKVTSKLAMMALIDR